MVVAGILKTEKIGWRKLLGIGLGASGAILLILSTAGGGPNGQNSPWGNLMILVNALFFATYLVLIRPMMKRYQTFTIVKWLFLFGSLMVLPFGWQEAMAVKWSTFAWQQWSAFVYIILGISILAYWLNAWSLKHVSSSVVGTYIYLQPVLATVIAVIWADEKLLVQQIIFAFLIFAGVYLVSEAKN